jgi:hypothetical protein
LIHDELDAAVTEPYEWPLQDCQSTKGAMRSTMIDI